MTRIARLAALGAVAVLIVAAVLLARYDPPPASVETIAAPTGAFVPLPESAAASRVAAILARSPFDADRGPFVREAVMAAPVTDVRLAGIMGAGAARRASLVIDGEARTVSVGDETPLGTVAAIEADAIVLTGGRRIGLID